jgi:hypothetical protein
VYLAAKDVRQFATDEPTGIRESGIGESICKRRNWSTISNQSNTPWTK